MMLGARLQARRRQWCSPIPRPTTIPSPTTRRLFHASHRPRLELANGSPTSVDAVPWLVQRAQDLLVDFHHMTGLPWWSSIALLSFTLRLCITTPLSLYTTRQHLRLQRLQPLLQLLQQNHASAAHPSSMPSIRDVYRRHRIRPFAGLLVPVLVQFPLFVCMSLALRHMCGMDGWLLWWNNSEGDSDGAVFAPFQEDASAGLWFPNLASVDPTLLSPLLMASSHLWNIHLNESLRGTGRAGMRSFFVVLAMLSFPIASQMPMAINVYWLGSSFYSLFQNLLLRGYLSHHRRSLASSVATSTSTIWRMPTKR